MPSIENNIFIVLIEDRAEDADRIREAIEQVKDASFRLQNIGRMSTALARVAGGGLDLIILSTSCAGDHDSEKLANLCKLRKGAPDVPVLVLTEPHEEELALRMIREGAEDYFVKSEGPSDGLIRLVRSALERKRNRSQAPLREPAVSKRAAGKVIGFLGAKGGVGTTTVALNVASKLAMEGTVIVVEAAPSRGLLPQYFRPHGFAMAWSELLGEQHTPDSEKLSSALRPCLAVPNLHGLMQPPTSTECLGMPSLVTESMTETLADLADYVILDFSSEVSQVSRDVIQQCDSTCLVVEGEPAALSSAKWTLGVLEARGLSRDRIGTVVVNRSSWANPRPLSHMRQYLGLDIVGVIPPALEECIRAFEAHTPLVVCVPDCIAAHNFVDLTSYFARPIQAKARPLGVLKSMAR